MNKFKINQEDVENLDLKHYNHVERKDLIKQIQKNKKIKFTDSQGNERITNEYKQRLNKEKHNLKKWLDRIDKSSEAGRMLRKTKEENMYNYRLHQLEILDANYRNFLEEVYGPEIAKVEYEKYKKRQDKRQNKILNKKL